MNIKITLLIAIFSIISPVLAGSYIEFFDTNTDEFPIIKTSYYAYDSSFKKLQNFQTDEFSITSNSLACNVRSVNCPGTSSLEKLSLTIVFDLSISNSDSIYSGFQKACDLSKSVIRYLDSQNTELALTSFDYSSYLNSDFTSNKAILYSKIDNFVRQRGSYIDAGLLTLPAGGIAVSAKGRYERAILLITDDRSPANSDSIITLAKLYGIRIFVICMEDYISSQLRSIAEGTGGKWFLNASGHANQDLLSNVLISSLLDQEPCKLEWLAPVNCDSIQHTIIQNDKKICEGSVVFDVMDSLKPHIISSPAYLSFGGVLPPGSKDLDITLKSVNKDILIDSLNLDDPHFNIVSGDVTNYLLQKEQLLKLTIRFTPTDSSIKFSFLNIFASASCFGNKIAITAGFPNTPPKDDDNKTIKLKAPLCGEVLIIGDTVPVEWMGLLPRDVIQLEYSTDGGKRWNILARDVNNLKYDWIVPDIETDSCLIRAIQLWPNNIGRTMDLRHDLGVNSAMFSTDNNLIVTASNDTTAAIWDSNNGHEIRRLLGHTQPLTWARFSHDDKWIVTAGEDSTAIIWDTESGRIKLKLLGHIDQVRSANFSPDGKSVITAGRDGYIFIWDAESGKIVDTLDFSPNQFWFATYSHDGKSILVSGNDPEVKLWDAVSKKLIKTFNTGIVQNGQGLNVHTTFSPDDKKIVTSSWFGKSIIWDINSGDTICTVSHLDSIGNPSAIFYADFNPTGDTLITSGFDHKAKMWNAKTGEFILNFLEHTSSVRTSVFNFDASRVLTSSWDFTAKVWNRNKRDLQMDTIKCSFRIARAMAETRDINFGQVPLGEVVDTVVSVFITSRSDFSFKVREIKITGLAKNDYSILNGLAPFVLNANETRQLRLRFRPLNYGFRPARIEIIIPNDTLYSELNGEGVAAAIEPVVKYIDFGRVALNEYKDSIVNVIIKNRSIDPITVDSIEIMEPDTENFDIISGQAPVKLYPEQTFAMTLRFTPLEIRRYNSQLAFYYNSVGSPTKISLFGEGFKPGYDTLFITIGNSTGKPGDVIDIPVKLNLLSSNAENLLSNVKTYLSFNSTLLEPLILPLTDEIRDNQRIISLDLPVTPGSSTFSTRFKVGLGNDSVTSIIPFNTSPVNDSRVIIFENAGIFKLDGVCQNGSPRLFDSEGRFSLSQNSPNPFIDETTVEFSLIENGMATIFIKDLLGNVVNRYYGKVMEKGSYSLKLDMRNLPSGIYILILSTPSQTLSKIIEKID